MKKIVLSFILITCAPGLFAQDTSATHHTYEYYRDKSKNQKTTAWILLGAGGAALAAGLIIGSNAANANDFQSGIDQAASGGALIVAGSASMLASIPFFIISGKNARKASSIGFNYQEMPLLQQSNIIAKRQPAIMLKIAL